MQGPGPVPTYGRASQASNEPWRLAPRTAATAGVRADGADTEWCALRAATVVGVRHRLDGTPAEDAWSWDGRSDAVAVAVADGVGSLPASAPVAAEVAVVAVAVALRRRPPEGAGDDDLIAAVDDDLIAAVDAANEAVRDTEGGASTLVVAVLSRQGVAHVARVGDSTAFVLSGSTWTEVFPDTESADDRGFATAALPSAVPAVEVRRWQLAPGDALMLVSDGVANPLIDGPTTVRPGMAEVLSSPPHPAVLASVLDFSRQGCHDDRTLVGVWWGRPAAWGILAP